MSFNLSRRGHECDANVRVSCAICFSGASWRPSRRVNICDQSISGCDRGKDFQQLFCADMQRQYMFILSLISFFYPSFFPLVTLFLPFCPSLAPLPFPSPPLQGVVAAEKSRGGQLLEEPKMLPFRANTFSLQVSIQDVPQFLWSIKPFTTCQVTMAMVKQNKLQQYVRCIKILSLFSGFAF